MRRAHYGNDRTHEDEVRGELWAGNVNVGLMIGRSREAVEMLRTKCACLLST